MDDKWLSNFYLILYLLAWVITLIIIIKRKRSFGAGALIVSTYVFYAVCSLLLYSHPMSVGEYGTMSFFPFVYLFLILLLFLQPVIRYNENNTICQPSPFLINRFIVLYIFSALFTLPYTLSHIQEGIMLILTTTEGGAELYNQSKDGVADHSMLMGLISAVFNILSDFGVLLLYYYLTLRKRNILLLVGLFISPFISILYSLSSGLRTEATMKLFVIITTFFLLRPNIDPILRKKISAFGVVFVGFALLVMTALTFSRFSNFTGGVSYEVERYIGEANLNFNEYCLDAGGIRHGDRTANQFKKMLFFDDVPKDLMETRAKYQNMKIDDASFVTFVGDFALDYGPFMGALILVVFSVIMIKSTRVPTNRPIKFHQLILIYLVMSISVQGGMYLFYYSYQQNYVLIAYFLTYWLFKWDSENQVRKKRLTVPQR